MWVLRECVAEGCRQSLLDLHGCWKMAAHGSCAASLGMSAAMELEKCSVSVPGQLTSGGRVRMLATLQLVLIS